MWVKCEQTEVSKNRFEVGGLRMTLGLALRFWKDHTRAYDPFNRKCLNELAVEQEKNPVSAASLWLTLRPLQRAHLG